MGRLSVYLSPFAGDYSGACAALFDFNCLIILCDAACCTKNYVDYDEPRWSRRKTTTLCAQLRTLEVTLGDDERLLRQAAEAALRCATADEVARALDALLQEAQALSDAGVKELIVIAQDITKYGLDLPAHKRLLPELLRKLCEMDFRWVRLHYLYPDQITDELIDVIASEPKIVNYLDIPLQHVSQRILRAMHRPGSGAEFAALIANLRQRIPGLVLRTSLIVGLPGETEEEFAELCSFLQETQIERVGVFEFSPEEGTEAAGLPDQIDAEVKANRRLIVEELQSGVLDDYNTARHGEVMEVLCEGFDDEQQLWYGRTYADSIEVDGHVYFESDAAPQPGEFVSVRITESLGPDLLGVQQKGE